MLDDFVSVFEDIWVAFGGQRRMMSVSTPVGRVSTMGRHKAEHGLDTSQARCSCDGVPRETNKTKKKKKKKKR